MPRMVIVIAAVHLAVVGGVFLWQVSLADAERDGLDAILDEQERAREMAKAAVSDHERLQADIQTCRDSLRHLRRRLPEALHVEEFVQTIRDIASRHGVEVVTASPRLVRSDFYDTAAISLELRGDPQRAETAILEMRRDGPLTGAEDLEHQGDSTTVTLLRFAVPAGDGPSRFQPCELEASRVWFPGLRGELAALRAEVESTCATVASMAEYVDRVNELFALRGELEVLTSIAGELARVPGTPATPEEMAEVEALIAEARVNVGPR